MIKVTSLRTKKPVNFEFNEFVIQFDSWETFNKRVFLNRVHKEQRFEFELSIYDFGDTDYLKFKARYME